MTVENSNTTSPEMGDDTPELETLGSGATHDENGHRPKPTDLSKLDQADIDKGVYNAIYSPQAVRKQKTLRHWQRLFAAWYATLPGPPAMDAMVAYAQALTTYRITPQSIRITTKRDDWRELVDQFRGSEALRVRELLHADYQFYLDAHRKGLFMALEKEDHRAIPSFTVPIIERFAPKKEDQAARAQVVIVNLQGGAAQQALNVIKDAEEAEVMEITEE